MCPRGATLGGSTPLPWQQSKWSRVVRRHIKQAGTEFWGRQHKKHEPEEFWGSRRAVLAKIRRPWRHDCVQGDWRGIEAGWGPGGSLGGPRSFCCHRLAPCKALCLFSTYPPPPQKKIIGGWRRRRAAAMVSGWPALPICVFPILGGCGQWRWRGRLRGKGGAFGRGPTQSAGKGLRLWLGGFGVWVERGRWLGPWAGEGGETRRTATHRLLRTWGRSS